MTEISLDSIDIKLLECLQKDSSLSNQALCQRVHISPATGLRRVKRLWDLGLIERQMVLLSPDRLAQVQGLGSGITALVEVSLDRQDAESMDAFEQSTAPEDAVQQCYRVSPGPDFVLVIHAPDMPSYQVLSQRLFSAARNVRNVKTYFSLKRAKFAPLVALSAASHRAAN